MQRNYNYSFAELCDRLNIVIQKIAFSESEEMKKVFIEERDNIIHDIDQFLIDGVEVTGQMISAICTLQFINNSIWNSEDDERVAEGRTDSGKEMDWEAEYKRLRRSHKINADRAYCKKRISQMANGKIDHKLNYISGQFNFDF